MFIFCIIISIKGSTLANVLANMSRCFTELFTAVTIMLATYTIETCMEQQGNYSYIVTVGYELDDSQIKPTYPLPTLRNVFITTHTHKITQHKSLHVFHLG